MIAEYISKMGVLIAECKCIVPHVFQAFHALLLVEFATLPDSLTTIDLITSFAAFYSLYHRYLHEEPELLSKLYLSETMAPHSAEIIEQMDTFLLKLKPFTSANPVSILMNANFQSSTSNALLREQALTATALQFETNAKSLKLHIFSNNETCVNFWLANFRTEYAVHF